MIYKAPTDISKRDPKLSSIFLAGSIEMDKAINWQKYCEEQLGEAYHVFNPRRESWDSSWKQSIDNPNFREQVEWELNALEEADIIILFFAGGTYSPISLLEFGLHAASGKLMVVCEADFWRKGNIDIVCQRYHIAQYESLEAVIEEIIAKRC